ncbi:hypothetical protein KCP74_12545 [Salmonella enterica subsp. enterica]|nr:hypothetical protein KCP74_12545 [Salmonella enterica subsp. enterica]
MPELLPAAVCFRCGEGELEIRFRHRRFAGQNRYGRTDALSGDNSYSAAPPLSRRYADG